MHGLIKNSEEECGGGERSDQIEGLDKRSTRSIIPLQNFTFIFTELLQGPRCNGTGNQQLK
jgi:hypothetical protein